MKMSRNEKKDVEVEYDRICNKCGESCRLDDYNYGGFEAIVYGQYSSTAIEDGTDYSFDICEKCAKEFIDTFKISCEHKVDFGWVGEEEPELDYEPGTEPPSEKE